MFYLLNQVTDNSENVFSLQMEDIADLPPDQQEGMSKNMFNHLKRLAKERDDYSEVLISNTLKYYLISNIPRW